MGRVSQNPIFIRVRAAQRGLALCAFTFARFPLHELYLPSCAEHSKTPGAFIPTCNDVQPCAIRPPMIFNGSRGDVATHPSPSDPAIHLFSQPRLASAAARNRHRCGATVSRTTAGVHGADEVTVSPLAASVDQPGHVRTHATHAGPWLPCAGIPVPFRPTNLEARLVVRRVAPGDDRRTVTAVGRLDVSRRCRQCRRRRRDRRVRSNDGQRVAVRGRARPVVSTHAIVIPRSRRNRGVAEAAAVGAERRDLGVRRAVTRTLEFESNLVGRCITPGQADLVVLNGRGCQCRRCRRCGARRTRAVR